MKTLRDLLKAHNWTNGGEDETLTYAKNRKLYLKTERSGRIIILTEIPHAMLSVEKNPGAFQTAQPDAPMPLPVAFRRTQPHRCVRHDTHACIPGTRQCGHPKLRVHPSIARS